MNDCTTTESRETYAYLAGIFDGNGSVFIATRIRNTRPVYWLVVQISARNREFAGWIAALSHGRVTSDGKFWKASSREAAAFLLTILPWLRLKHEQARLAIEFQTMLSSKPQRTTLTPHELAILEEYRNRIRTLNEQQYRTTEGYYAASIEDIPPTRTDC